jgi:membrane protein DedA with SNARE-associated domain/uncharacterized tellurite resistance protein B-like protein
VYAIVALVAFLENAFPPTPSDVAVALAAFLSHHGVTTPFTVFLTAWLASSVGAVVVYATARRYGRSLFSGRLGRKLLSPHAVATIEREYLRFGIAGIFIGRLLPGVRSFVAPFAGITNLSPARALIPMILASGLWYAGLTMAGTYLGAEWESINHFISGLNRTLAIIAGILALVVAIYLLMRRLRSRQERLWSSITRAFGAGIEPDSPVAEGPALAAAATLMVELARADETLSPSELETVATYLGKRWELPPMPLPSPGKSLVEQSKLLEYSNQLSRDYRKPERLALIDRLWRAAFSDGALPEQEERLMCRAGALLGLSDGEVADARERARANDGQRIDGGETA